MTSEHTRYGLVVLVALLAVGLTAVGPALATPAGTATDDTVGDALTDGSDDSSTDSTNSTDDSSTNTTSSSDTTSESDTGDSTSSSSDSGAETSDSDREVERTVATTDALVSAVQGRTLAALTSAVPAGSSSFALGTATTTSTETTGALVRYTDSVDEQTLTDAVSTLDVDTGLTTTAASDTESEFERIHAPRVEAFTGVSTNAFGGAGERPPAGPTAGLALGLVGIAAAAVTRHGALAPGVFANLGTALTASVAAPVSARGLFDRLARMFAPLRYSRYDDSDPLEHEARADVFEIVEESPGAYLSEVSERADIPLSTARHHIRVLEREDLVSGAKVRGKRRFYPAHTKGIELAAAMNDDATAAILDALARLGAASVSALADEVSRDPSTITHHLQRLEEDGIIVRERDGRAVMNKLSTEARMALEPEAREAEVPEAGEAMASD